jgi:O-antigen/teichoic acid export membrane protein
MKARLLANLNWLIANKILRLIGELFIGVWIARYLGPEQFGVLNYALAFVAIFGTVARLGMDQVVVRDLTRHPGREGAILGTVFVLKLVAGLMALILVIPTAWVAQNGDLSFTALIAVIAVGMIFNSLDTYDIYYQTHILSRYVVLARGAAFLFFSVVRVGLILGEYSVGYFAAASTLEIALGGMFLMGIFRHKQEVKQKWRFERTIMSGLLRDGWPLIISSWLIIIHTRIDQVMIGQMLGNADVGIYSAAVRLSEAWLFMPVFLAQTLMPYFVKIRESNSSLYHARLIQLYSIMFWLGVLVGVVTIVIGENLVVVLLGEPYRSAYLPLVLTIWTGIFISQSVARGIWMIGENMQRYRLANNLVAVPVNIALNLLLIPRYGVVGAAVSSLVSIGLGTWFVPYLFKPLHASNNQMLRAINPKYLLLGSRYMSSTGKSHSY